MHKKITKTDPRLKLCAKRLNRFPLLSTTGRALLSDIRIKIAHISDLSKDLNRKVGALDSGAARSSRQATST